MSSKPVTIVRDADRGDDPGVAPTQGAAEQPGRGPVPKAVEIPAGEQELLLELATLAVRSAVRGAAGDLLRSALLDGPLPARTGAAFVTLTEGGELRGCMGRLDERAPAWRSVVEAARLAALGDPRFEPVAPRELRRLHLDVSVLGPMLPLPDAGAFRPGTDGIAVERAGRRALLLPEVSTMLEPQRHAMLEAVCRKAGLQAGAWRDPATTLWVFRTCRFGGSVEP